MCIPPPPDSLYRPRFLYQFAFGNEILNSFLRHCLAVGNTALTNISLSAQMMMLRQVRRFISGVMLREAIRIASFIRSHVAYLYLLTWCPAAHCHRLQGLGCLEVVQVERELIMLLCQSVFLEKFCCGFHERP
jgi:hypothetical protein